jgi:putative peptide maturation dehydrogenase
VDRIRRTRFALYQLDPWTASRLPLGELPRADGADEIYAHALLTGGKHRLTLPQFALLASVTAREMTPVGDRPRDEVGQLAALGLLITDSDEPELAALAARDAALARQGWHLHAAAFHFMTQWSGTDLRAGAAQRLELGPQEREAARDLLARSGPPPDPFPPPRPGPATPLPPGERTGGLYDALMARRTTRAFATDAAMRAEDLATVLRYVFGAHGEARNVAGIALLKRTSPSGGAMHPIEGYPMITGVAGIAPGIYHYDARGHRLETVAELHADARADVTRLLAGQDYFGDAHASIALTARFSRNHWKYRDHPKAYPGILMDAAHLSQTLYLVAAELGLGAYVTLAINGRELEDRLGLDGVAEGVIAVCGCGVRSAGDSPLELRFS